MSLKDKKLFLLDMDGTIYLENTLIEGTKKFLQLLKEESKQYIFMTNNSSKSCENYVDKLKSMGIECNKNHVFTSGMAMGIYLNKLKHQCKIYLCGTKALKEELERYDITVCPDICEGIDYVVVGFDMELNYKKLQDVCYLIDKGVKFLATNPDLVCPIAGGRYIPDCGSMCRMITTATKVNPFYIGKPNRYMVDILSELTAIPHSKIAIVGDRLYTDIATGKNANITSICVFSGECTIDDIKVSDIKPDYIFNSIYDLYLELK